MNRKRIRGSSIIGLLVALLCAFLVLYLVDNASSMGKATKGEAVGLVVEMEKRANYWSLKVATSGPPAPRSGYGGFIWVNTNSESVARVARGYMLDGTHVIVSYNGIFTKNLIEITPLPR